ncbi:5-hydroxytryptamine receptor 3A-like [Branchiostoma floridae]|uniref:5-hydroxytryptamine receptor 3A-like n=1 Tax=Branchiostoma floridae TaxID=7739 RepID=A0A9J7L538_BRAFL|nr:5-hydroxytryptamine receptor 3A-like [Branchiostoma floridae]
MDCGNPDTTVCDADPFYFPADTMECHVCFASAIATEQTIQCQGGRSTTGKENGPCDSLSASRTEGEWYRMDQIFAKNNREACFALQLSRIPLFHIATTVGPCVILVVLMIITFIMPMDKGDRISFGVTIQLSMVVSLVFVTEVLPVKGALPFFATLIIVCMGLMGVFLFFTIAIIIIHDKQGSLSPAKKTFFLRYMSRMLLLGDLSHLTERESKETGPVKQDIFELTNDAFNPDDVTAIDGEGFAQIEFGNDSRKHQSSGLESNMLSCLSKLMSSVDELTKALNHEEEEVTDYTLLADVLDRLCLVLYIVSIAAAIPMTMYLGK